MNFKEVEGDSQLVNVHFDPEGSIPEQIFCLIEERKHTNEIVRVWGN